MAQAKKFGALSGVFTPSILTILGVIMYLRLPAIVGQGGLVQTLLIIAVAHVISVTTGLSVSSIATDKKVRAGGTYYMISRSLGLPIGGTLGLALFVGLSFSVSLYLIGFSESFLTYSGLPTDLTAIRIAGSVTLVAVTVVTLISTALALRAQFFVMAAIALSLLSIVLGSHDLAPAAPPVELATTAAPFIVLFGIFFPAVTGFEAGVSMSGDLSDPKSAIPKGTIGAILVGLLVYIALATFLAATVSADQLAGNPRILLDIALFPPLVVAGIWGATISSAFGSILGAPRILQATSVDGVTPRWFGRGYGRENEPRHALVMAFVIAEAGILIGELDAIARIVSMFFITTYGVLNLAAAIETRVSPDFRPEFRVPALIPLVGSVACFIVMIQLDFVAMVGASVVLAGLYLYLKRKQLRLEAGDTWQGVWSTMARAALSRLDRADTKRRNWRPNILLFGDDSASSAPRVELARQLTSQRGVLTRVQVVPSADADPTTPVAPATMAPRATDPSGQEAAEPDDGEVFTRRFHGGDVYETIAQVARFYGFSGIEPNTVLLGWARSGDGPRFTNLLQRLVEEDLNVLLLDFDRNRGYGRHERIDVWWRLTGKDVAFSLALVRFLTTSDRWRDARVRFLTVNDGPPALTLPIGRDLARVLEDHRLEADVRVINNAADRRSFVDIVRRESLEADLTVLGMADVRGEDRGRFIADTNALVDVLGTALLAHASSFFQEPLIESAALTALQSDAGTGGDAERLETERLPPLAEPAGEPIPALLSGLDAALQDRVRSLFDDYLGRAYELNRSALDGIGAFAVAALEDARDAPPGDATRAGAGASFLDAALERVAALRETAAAQGALLAAAADRLPAAVAALAETVPERVVATPPREAWRRTRGESLAASLARLRARLSSAVRRRPPSYRTPLREIARTRLAVFADRALGDAFAAFAADASRAAEAAGRLLANALEQVDRAGRQPDASGGAPGGSGSRGPPIDARALRDEAAAAAKVSQAAARRARFDAAVAARETVNMVADDAARLDGARALREARRTGPSSRASTGASDRSAEWEEVQDLAIAQVELALQLQGLADVVARTGRVTRARIADLLEGELVAELEQLRAWLGEATERPAEWATSGLDAVAFLDAAFHPEALVERVRVGLAEDVASVPASVSVPAAESADDIAAGRFEVVVAATFPARQVAEYLIEADLLGPLLDELSGAAPQIAYATELGREVTQLAAFHFGSQNLAGGSAPSREEVATLLDDAVQRTELAIAVVREVREQLDAGVEQRFAALAGRLDGTTIHRLAERMPEYLRSQRGRQVLGGARRVGQRVAAWAREQVVRLVYRRSEGIVLARQLIRGAAGDPESLEPVRRFVEAVSPRPAVLAALPDYYRQLFLGHPAVTEQLRVGFNRELAEADAALAASRGGGVGAIVVLGEPGQGRRFLSGLIAQRHAGAAGVFRVDAPDGGSVDPATFTARVRRALGRPEAASPSTLATALPPGSALVVNDLECWWERSPGGDAVLDALDTFIAHAPVGCLVVLNAAPRSFRLINRMRPLDDRVLRLIECEAFNARQLRQVILPRHASTGLTFEWNGRGEDQLAELRLARLFNAHFDFCNGNVGIALQAWIANIERVDGERLYIRAPDQPPLDALEALGHVQLMLLVQLLLHGRLTRRRLARLSRLDPVTLARGLRGLVRAGLVHEGSGGTLAVDRFVRPHLARFLIERGAL